MCKNTDFLSSEYSTPINKVIQDIGSDYNHDLDSLESFEIEDMEMGEKGIGYSYIISCCTPDNIEEELMEESIENSEDSFVDCNLLSDLDL